MSTVALIVGSLALIAGIVALVLIGINWQTLTQNSNRNNAIGRDPFVAKSIETIALNANSITSAVLDTQQLKINGQVFDPNASGGGGASGGTGGTITLHPPQVTSFQSAGSFTYNTPAGALYIQVTAQGGGQGGNSDDGTQGTNGSPSSVTDGTNTITANGGQDFNGGSFSVVGANAQGFGFQGNAPGIVPWPGPALFGGLQFYTSGTSTPSTNGAGGWGGGGSAPGGGSGGYVQGIISGSLASSFTVTVGPGGLGGPPGFGVPGVKGGDGWVIVTAYFQ